MPALSDKISLKEFSARRLSDALMTLLPWDLRARLEREAPTHFEAPTGTMLAIDYEAEQGPTIAVRLQELFGLNSHPSIAKGAVPLVLELLSPAHRPGAGDARPAGLLARQLCRGALRPARALSEASLAGGSGERDADPAGQAAGNVRATSLAPFFTGRGGVRGSSANSEDDSEHSLAPHPRFADANATSPVKPGRRLIDPLTLRSSFSPKWQPSPPPLVATLRLAW